MQHIKERGLSIVWILIIVAVVIVGGFIFFSSQQPEEQELVVVEKPQENNMEQENTPAGLQIEDISVGEGAVAVSGDQVTVHYVGTFEDGTVFDSSRAKDTPFAFLLGAGRVIQGWDEGVVGMKIGGIRKLVIPPELAYGERGAPGAIPPNSTLYFEIELLKIQGK